MTSRVERRRERIPYSTRTVASGSLARGVVQTRQAGRAGLRVKVYRLILRDGVVERRQLIRTVVKRRSVQRVRVRGTHVARPTPVATAPPRSRCDPNYAGACVPVSSDVDCGGGSGNGPAYVYGTVRVVGYDVYDLDRDGDGYGCD